MISILKTITKKEYKKFDLGLLKFLKDVCDKYKLKYYLAYGTLIGAIRHQGMIPWDDDLDVMMPREDFLKFEEIVGKGINSNYEVISTNTHPEFTAPLPKLVDNRTLLVQKYDFKERTELGIYLDIFILDGAGNTYDEAVTTYKKAYKLYTNWRISDFKLFPPHRNKLYGILRYMKYIKYELRGVSYYLDTVNNFDSKLSFYDSEYIATLSSGESDFKSNVWKKSDFGEGINVNFEGDLYLAPVNYDKLLKLEYGNYMQLPPKEKQISNHNFAVFLK